MNCVFSAIPQYYIHPSIHPDEYFQFCPDHKTDTGPVVLAEHLSAETKAKLAQSRSMKNYAQGLNFVMSSKSIIGGIAGDILKIAPLLWLHNCPHSRQYILHPLAPEIWQAERHVPCQVVQISLQGSICDMFRWANISTESWEHRTSIPSFVGNPPPPQPLSSSASQKWN